MSRRVLAGSERGEFLSRTGWLLLGVMGAFFSVSCEKAAPSPRMEKTFPDIRLATTTSTENSGLLDVLLKPFEERHGVKVEVIAVGTGKALEHGRNGDVDVILVHARSRELHFIREGYGVNRRDVMHNDFIVVGPPADPAGIRTLRNAEEAFRQMHVTRVPFVSRGDNSGTHFKERFLWEQAGVSPKGEAWYMEAGQGMAAVLTMADEKEAYALTDRGTYLAVRSRLGMSVLVEGDEILHNPYGIIAVNPARYSVNYEGAMSLISWVTSPQGQAIIADFKKEGERLFYPDAVQVK